MTSTTYFFDVSADALEGALDRFAGFFYEPLFNEDCTEREIKAVDSEHKKNLQSDMWVSSSVSLSRFGDLKARLMLFALLAILPAGEACPAVRPRVPQVRYRQLR
jgi:hypothetical protein